MNRSSQPLTLSRASVSGSGFSGGVAAATIIQPSASLLVNVLFTPTTRGASEGLLTFSFTTANGALFSTNFFITGTALVSEVIASYIVNPSGNQVAANNGDTIRFNPANVGETSTVTLILTNRGNGRAVLRQANVSGEAFRASGLPLLPADIAPDREIRFTLSFSPTSRSLHRETFQIVIDSATIVLLLEGQGIGASYRYQTISSDSTSDVSDGGSISLSPVSVASTSTIRVRITNGGNANGRINTLGASGTGFQITDIPALPATLAPGASLDVLVSFTPRESGRQTGRLRIENASFELVGSGIGPRLELSSSNDSGVVPLPNGATLNFPNTSVGQRSVAEVKVLNAGNAPLTVNNAAVSGAGFALTNNTALPAQLPPGESFTVRVIFAPETLGSLTGALQIDEYRIQLRGAATSPAPLPTVSLQTSSDMSQPLQQPTVKVLLERPYPLPITGSLSLSFNSDSFSDDPAIQFASGARTAAFRIPENTTEAVFADGAKQIQFQTGTVSGTISVSAALAVSSVNLTPNPAPAQSVVVPQSEPRLTSVQVANRSATSFDLVITGYSTSRSVSQIGLQFTGAPGAQLQTSTLTQPVEAQFNTWYQNSSSRAFGSQFVLTLHVNGTGDLNGLQSVSVTATNGKGTSSPVTTNLR